MNLMKKFLAALLPGALLAACLSTGLAASAESSYVFTENFDDGKISKAVSVFVQGGDPENKCYGFTTNAPMVESMPDDRDQVMMKCLTTVESSITYEFKDGFSSFEYIGYGGGRWGGIYGKTGIFKIQWSDSLNGTYHDFKQKVVGPNKGKTTSLANGEMTLDRPEQESAGLAYFYSNKIPSSAKYLRLWFMASPAEGDSHYYDWMAALVSLKVKAYGTDPHAPATTTSAATTTKAPTAPPTTKVPDQKPPVTDRPANNTTASTPSGDTSTEPAGTTEPTAGYTGPTDEFGTPITVPSTTTSVAVLTSSSDTIVINDSWKTVTVPSGTTVGDLAKALTIAGGYDIKLFDSSSNAITSSSAELTTDTLIRLYQDGKVVLTYTVNLDGSSSSFPLWAVFVIIGGVLLIAGVVLLIVFRDKIFRKRS